MFKGITASCSGFYAPQGRVLRYELARPNFIGTLHSFHYGDHRITNFEMETSAIYGLGKLLGHRCLSLNTMVANRIEQTFSKDGNAAVQALITKTLGILTGIG